MPLCGQAGEQVRQVQIFEGIALAAVLLAPVRRRPEILPRLMRAQLVIGRTLLGGLQRLVGLGNLLEFLFTGGVLRHVRVILVRELAVRLLDVRGAGVARDTENLVVVLVLHRDGLAGKPGSRPASAMRTCSSSWSRSRSRHSTQ